NPVVLLVCRKTRKKSARRRVNDPVFDYCLTDLQRHHWRVGESPCDQAKVSQTPDERCVRAERVWCKLCAYQTCYWSPRPPNMRHRALMLRSRKPPRLGPPFPFLLGPSRLGGSKRSHVIAHKFSNYLRSRLV